MPVLQLQGGVWPLPQPFPAHHIQPFRIRTQINVLPLHPCPAPSGRGSVVAPGLCCNSRVVYSLCHSHSQPFRIRTQINILPLHPLSCPSGRGSVVAPGLCCSSSVVYGLCHSQSLLVTYNHLGSGHRLISSPSTPVLPPQKGVQSRH
jgi:hypothetical protein